MFWTRSKSSPSNSISMPFSKMLKDYDAHRESISCEINCLISTRIRIWQPNSNLILISFWLCEYRCNCIKKFNRMWYTRKKFWMWQMYWHEKCLLSLSAIESWTKIAFMKQYVLWIHKFVIIMDHFPKQLSFSYSISLLESKKTGAETKYISSSCLTYIAYRVIPAGRRYLFCSHIVILLCNINQDDLNASYSCISKPNSWLLSYNSAKTYFDKSKWLPRYLLIKQMNEDLVEDWLNGCW